MSKHLKVTLIALMLVAALAACGKDNPQNTTNPTGEVGTSAESEPTVTEPTETTVPETTPPETTAPAALPEVKDGTVYTKEAIDYAFGGGSFGFTHALLIPAIDSTKPGAEALNAKMLADQQEKLDALAAGKEENHLYTVNYSTSGADGILVINVYEYYGWQYSESGTTRRFYYYDAAADCELTADEVLTRLSFTKETLAKAFRWSSEFNLVTDEGTEEQTACAESVFGTPLDGTPEQGKFYYAERNCNAELELLGIDFDETTVSPCYRYILYTVGTLICPIDRATGQPLLPYYECTPNIADLKVGDSFRITIKDGKVTEMTAPADAKVQRIKISSCGLSVYYSADAAFDYSNAVFFVNGKDRGVGAMHSMTDTANIYLMYRSFSDYIPLDKLNTLEFSVKSNLD